MNRRYLYLCAAFSLSALLLLTASGSTHDSNSNEIFRDPARQLAPRVYYPLNTPPWVACVGDFNGDGKIDLAVAGIASNGTSITVTIALGVGDGTFTFGNDFTIASGGYPPSAISAADFNHDGKIDLLVTNEGLGVGTVNIFLGNGDGTFTTGATYSAGGLGAVIGDFNGDGIPDIATPQQSENGVDILLGNGDGTFTFGTSLSVPGAAGNPLAADLNHDGKLDLVLQMAYTGFNVALGNGDGTFQPAVFSELPDSFTREVIADFNQDGIPDVGFAGAYDYCSPLYPLIIGVALGNGDGTFQTPIIQRSNVCGGTDPVAADFNGDGKIDLLEVISQKLFLANGPGTFEAGEFSGSDGAYSFFFGGLTADLNGDGAPDLVVLDDLYNQFHVALNVSGDSETLTSSVNPSEVGQSVTFTANVIATVAKKAVTGTVTFRDGSVTLSRVTLSGGMAAFTTSNLAAGTHTISAVYSGDKLYRPKTAGLVQIVRQ